MSIISTNQEGDVELDAWVALNNRADERDNLLEIVQAFAADEPRDELGYCLYCTSSRSDKPHDDDCIWRKAQKWKD
jgi:hypothetical protein